MYFREVYNVPVSLGIFSMGIVKHFSNGDTGKLIIN